MAKEMGRMGFISSESLKYEGSFSGHLNFPPETYKVLLTARSGGQCWLTDGACVCV